MSDPPAFLPPPPSESPPSGPSLTPARSGLSRRQVVLGGAAAASLAVMGASGAALVVRSRRGRSDAQPGASSVPADQRVLVLITLYGGNDGLGTVAPVADATYRSARGPLALDPATAHPLADGFALHPALKDLKATWDRGHLAVVLGVGSAKPDRSHFSSMDQWQTAMPDGAVRSGWIGRWLDTTGTEPLRALATTPTLPTALLGERVAGATLPPGLAVGSATGKGKGKKNQPDAAQGVPTGALGDAYRVMVERPDGPDLVSRAAAVGGDLLVVAERVGTALAPEQGPTGSGSLDDQGQGAAAGGGELGSQMAVVARLVRAGLPTRVYASSLGGFDTHAEQADTHTRLLGELDGALSRLFTGLGDQADRVVVLVTSEFGRRVAVNGSNGTDHGRASVALVVGPSVIAGLHGDPPPLTNLDDGDLRVTTDFRSTYAGVLGGMGIDPDASLPGPQPQALRLLR